jgi:hypothetical protein
VKTGGESELEGAERVVGREKMDCSTGGRKVKEVRIGIRK